MQPTFLWTGGGFPAQPEGERLDPGASAPREAPAEDGRRKVLLVDDERDFVELLTLRLESGGEFIVEPAYDGVMALSKVETFHPDVILLDLMMPNMDGMDFCRRLRSMRSARRIPVIVMTAAEVPQAPSRWVKLGANGFVVKPFDTAGLIEALKRIKVGTYYDENMTG